MAIRVDPRLPRWLTAAYCGVQFGKTLLWIATDLVAFYVLVVVEKLSPGTVSIILIGGLAWHGSSDIVIGQWLRRGAPSARRLAIVAAVAMPLACLGFISALWWSPVAPLLALGAMMVSRSAYALFDVPHCALLAAVTRRGLPTVRIVGLRNLSGHVASLVLGLGLTPSLGPHMTSGGLLGILVGIAMVSALTCWPVVSLIDRLWQPWKDEDVPQGSQPWRAAVAAVLAVHFYAGALSGTVAKLTVVTLAPGAALVALSAGRILGSIPLPGRWPERYLGITLSMAVMLLLIAAAALCLAPGWLSLIIFGAASAWINVLAWSWLGHETDDPRVFATATMITKAALILSIAIAAPVIVGLRFGPLSR